MVYGKNMMWTAALALAAAATTLTAQQKQSIPDAPRPQTLPDLRTITPTAPAVPESTSTATPEDAGQPNAPGSTLPSSPQSNTPPPPDDNDGAPPPQRTGESFRIRIESNFVEVPFIVKDSKGQQVPGITYRDVRVYENNTRQAIANFTSDPFPLSVALVIDQSVTDDTMTKINNALGALPAAFSPYDEISVFTYNNGVVKQTAATGAQSARLAQVLVQSKGKGRAPVSMYGGPLSKGINKNGMAIDPNTAGGNRNHPGAFDTPEKEIHTLNDAILTAAVDLSKSAQGRRRIVYVISDGKEYGSKAKQNEVVKYCLTHKIAVWGTLVGDSAIYGLGFLDRIHIPYTMRDNALTHFTNATAGQLDSEFRQGGIEKSFTQIAAEARNQYTLGYYSHEPLLDGKYRKVDVRVLRPGLQIIAKDGYFPTPGDNNRPQIHQPATPVTQPTAPQK